jgi:hypothetical protein
MDVVAATGPENGEFRVNVARLGQLIEIHPQIPH